MAQKGDETTYEWVIELMDGDEIADCDYWDEGKLLSALEARTQMAAANPGKTVDFGLCRRLGNEIDGELDRWYAYFEGERLPERFEAGPPVPLRFREVRLAPL